MNSFQKMKYLHRNRKKEAPARPGRKGKQHDRGADPGKDVQGQTDSGS